LYPYYKCDPFHGGRGWLFWLLSHNPPLRKAALSVAALHQRASSRPEDRDDETELLLYHTSALSGLRQALCITGERYLTDDPDEFIKLLACGCSLISFEVKSHILNPSDDKLLIAFPGLSWRIERVAGASRRFGICRVQDYSVYVCFGYFV
jgi:hypothetical protein